MRYVKRNGDVPWQLASRLTSELLLTWPMLLGSQPFVQKLSICANRGECSGESPDVPRQVLLTLAIEDLGNDHPASLNLYPCVQQ